MVNDFQHGEQGKFGEFFKFTEKQGKLGEYLRFELLKSQGQVNNSYIVTFFLITFIENKCQFGKITGKTQGSFSWKHVGLLLCLILVLVDL